MQMQNSKMQLNNPLLNKSSHALWHSGADGSLTPPSVVGFNPAPTPSVWRTPCVMQVSSRYFGFLLQSKDMQLTELVSINRP